MARRENLGKSDSFGSRFGALVKRKRLQQGLSLAELAARIYPKADPTGQRRAPDVNKFELGESEKPRARTIALYQEALNINQAEIDTLVSDDDRPRWLLTQRLIEEKQNLARKLQLSQSLVIEIAERYSEIENSDFESAVRGLERALGVASKAVGSNTLPSNLDDAALSVFKAVEELSRVGDFDSAMRLLKEQEGILEAKSHKISKEKLELYDKGIEQAIMMRSVDDAVTFESKKITLRCYPKDLFKNARLVLDMWRQRGAGSGIKFDIEVSIALSEVARQFENTPIDAGLRKMDLGISFMELGKFSKDLSWLDDSITALKEATSLLQDSGNEFEHALAIGNTGLALFVAAQRDNDLSKFERAIENFEYSLKYISTTNSPTTWVIVKNSMANSKTSIGFHLQKPDPLDDAIKDYRSVIDFSETGYLLPDKHYILNNFGSTLAILGSMRRDSNLIKDGITKILEALSLRDKENQLLLWGASKQNLGMAYGALAEITGFEEDFEQSIESLRNAQESINEEKSPYQWAFLSHNLGKTYNNAGEKLHKLDYVEAAERELDVAHDIFLKFGSEQIIQMTELEKDRAKEIRRMLFNSKI